MFKEKKSSFRKSMAFLVFVAFIFTVFPEVTHAATNPSSDTYPFPKKYIRFISAIFSFAGLNLSTSAYDLALFYSLGNLTSQKKPTSQDDE